MSKIRKVNSNTRLTHWKMAALTNLIDQELGRRADDPPNPYTLRLQLLRSTLEDAYQIVATKRVLP